MSARNGSGERTMVLSVSRIGVQRGCLIDDVGQKRIIRGGWMLDPSQEVVYRHATGLLSPTPEGRLSIRCDVRRDAFARGQLKDPKRAQRVLRKLLCRQLGQFVPRAAILLDGARRMARSPWLDRLLPHRPRSARVEAAALPV